MFSIADYIILLIGAVLVFLWIILSIAGKKHSEMFDSLDEKEFPLKGIYSVGYSLLLMVGYKFSSKGDRKLRKYIEILYGEDYVEYYLRVIHSQAMTFAFLLLAFAVPLYALADDILMLVIMVVVAALAYYYFYTLLETRMQARSEAFMNDFSNVVSKLALLINAGMIMRQAWEKVAMSGETPIYKEMQKSVYDMQSGIPEVDAIIAFGSRSCVPEVKKFASTIAQGIAKGNRELAFMLKDQSSETWFLKKQHVKRQGEKASGKLMIPIMIMFVGVIIMVVVPIFAGIGI